MSGLEGKVAIVTGSARSGSIGRAIALELAARGTDVAINDLDRSEEAAELADAIARLGRRSLAVMADVSNVAECRRLVSEAASHFGRLDILINNAGSPRLQKVSDITEADWDFMLDLFLKGPFFLSQAAARHMLKAGGGRIINISSEQAYIGHGDLPHYTAAKAGLNALSKSLARAFAPLITVNTVAPGPTASERFRQGSEYTEDVRRKIPLQRWGLPEDVARSVAFLASSDGDAYTGQTLDPNCGVVMP